MRAAPSRRRSLALAAWLGLAVAGGGPCAWGAASDIGEWSPVYPWPQVAVHLHVLPDRKLLTYSDEWVQGQKVTPSTSRAYVVQIPDGGPPSTTWTYVPNDNADLFCAGHTFLPDGRLLVIGGQDGAYYKGIAASTIFNYQGGYSWETPANGRMARPRWYPSAITLASGDILALGGSMTSKTDPNTLPEVWQTATGGWRPLLTGLRALPFYPWIFQAPNGQVFLAGHKAETRYLDTTGTGKWNKLYVRKYASRFEGSAVMYDEGKILVAGGGSPATNTAEIINLRAAAPSWQLTGSMASARRYMNATVLPDGKVLVTGGGAGANNADQAVLTAELWDPATGRWSTMASMQKPRLYHGTAVLLPDGRVLSTGSGRPPPTHGVNSTDAEIFSPPYLFAGPRPELTSAPEAVAYGEKFFVGTPNADVTTASWIKLSSVTHDFNSGQRFSRLKLAPAAGGLTVTAPSDPRLSPPGHYMLFLLNAQGVPSISRIVRIG
ncbi:MAG: galactose oxidase-like domain-containing protein [Geminicoccaceae bacterium]